MIGEILSKVDGVIIDGNTFEISEEELSCPLLELLQESRRVPEMVILLSVS